LGDIKIFSKCKVVLDGRIERGIIALFKIAFTAEGKED
tara:strand:- start:128 stop:241 length:114 start_codon:yes stop_codon:yes gene_type:complete